jgi:hypothetical protein
MVGGLNLAFAETDKKRTMIDLRKKSTNWFINQLCPSIRLSRLCALVCVKEDCCIPLQQRRLYTGLLVPLWVGRCILVLGTFSCLPWTTSYRKVHLMAKERYSLIQTDKGKYKPKDKVQFRSANEGGSRLPAYGNFQ